MPLKSFFLIFLLTAFTVPFGARAETAGPYTWHNAIFRMTPAKIGSGYVRIENPTAQPDRLTGASASWAERIELHQVATTVDGVKTMHKVGAVALPAKSALALQPGGYHLMLFGIRGDAPPNGIRDITLTFEQAGDLVIPFKIQALSQADAEETDAHSHHPVGDSGHSHH